MKGRAIKTALAAFALLVIGAGFATPSSAHPLDQLTQHLFVQLEPTQVELTVALGGGLLANELVLTHLNPNGDNTITPVEQRAWLERWSRNFSLSMDGKIVPVSADQLTVSVPSIDDFHLGVHPLLLSFTAPL